MEKISAYKKSPVGQLKKTPNGGRALKLLGAEGFAPPKGGKKTKNACLNSKLVPKVRLRALQLSEELRQF